MYKTKSKLGVFLFLSIMAIVVVVTVSALRPDTTHLQVINTKSDTQVIIPARASQIADGVFLLGFARDVDGRIVEGYMFVDYKKGYGHKPTHNPGGPGGNPGGNGGGESNCFAFLAKGAKWKTAEPYIVDTFNIVDLDEAFIRTNLAADIQEWETAAGSDIFGDEDLSLTVDRTNIGNLNGQNEVIFADISSSGAIAVTIVWGIFGGPPFARELVEWDQIYDDFDFTWNNDGNPNDMDFENIAQHELGHSFGLGHPDGSCTEETMFAFASNGETKKRTLNAGDIAGVQNLYT